MSRRLRGVIVLAVFVVVLVYGIAHLKHTSAPSGPAAPVAAFAVVDAASACRAWAGIDPVITQAVQANDPIMLYRLESRGGPQGEYEPLMRWAQLAAAREQSVILATDLTNLQGEIASAASGNEALGDLPVPATEIVDQCQYRTPSTGASGDP